MAGQYVPRREVKRILDAIANGGIDSLEGIDRAFDRIAADYDHYARSWAEGCSRNCSDTLPPQKRSQKP